MEKASQLKARFFIFKNEKFTKHRFNEFGMSKFKRPFFVNGLMNDLDFQNGSTRDHCK